MREVFPGLSDLLVGIDHVGIAVNDLAAAIDFYENTLGFELLHIEENATQQVREAMLKAPNSDQIQLLAPANEQSIITKFLERSGAGVQQLALQVTDVRLASDRLRAIGLALVYDEPQPGGNGTLINFVHPKSCGGVLLELVEVQPNN